MIVSHKSPLFMVDHVWEVAKGYFLIVYNRFLANCFSRFYLPFCFDEAVNDDLVI
jgi:hypothetical protein